MTHERREPWSRSSRLGERLLPPSPVGAGLKGRPYVRLLALGTGIGVVAMDLLWSRRGFAADDRRLVASAVGVAVLALLARDRAPTLGIRAAPRPSLRWWVVACLVVGLVVLAVSAAFAGYLVVSGTRIPLRLQVDSAAALPVAAWRTCVWYPLVEEASYRWVLVPALVPIVRSWGAVCASGIAFAALHHVYGNPGPDNQVAGFVLAWAFLRSGCFWMPLALHASGNAFVLLAHLGIAEGWWSVPGVLPTSG